MNQLELLARMLGPLSDHHRDIVMDAYINAHCDANPVDEEMMDIVYFMIDDAVSDPNNLFYHQMALTTPSEDDTPCVTPQSPSS